MPDKPFLLPRERTGGLLGKQIGEPHDRVQGRAQFVTHGCKKVALQTIGLFYLTISDLQFHVGYRQVPGSLFEALIQYLNLFFHGLAIGDISNDTDNSWSRRSTEWA